MLELYDDTSKLTANDILTPNPKVIDAGELATEALATMRAHNISQLVVLRDGNYAGMLHLHDLMREGII